MVAAALVSAAREEILGRIRRALGDVPADERADDVPVTREYAHGAPAGAGDPLARLADRLRDYGAEVDCAAEADAAARVAAACAERGLREVVVPPALPRSWRPDGVHITEDAGLDAATLDGIDGVVSGCALAIAETGTIVLDGRDVSGRRAITLVPDHHVCVVRAEQIVGSVPEAIAALGPAARDDGRPITFVSGPSASSDIELSRVEGVHGPRDLVVLILR